MIHPRNVTGSPRSTYMGLAAVAFAIAILIVRKDVGVDSIILAVVGLLGALKRDA